MRGVELVDADWSDELLDVRINRVDIAPLVDAELNRRYLERAAMRPTTQLVSGTPGTSLSACGARPWPGQASWTRNCCTSP
jgi:hypothetical protein